MPDVDIARGPTHGRSRTATKTRLMETTSAAVPESSAGSLPNSLPGTSSDGIAPTRAPRRTRPSLQGLVRKKPPSRFRGTPPPPTFDFEALADGTHLTQRETAAVLRRAMSCLENWRQDPEHPLKWQRVAGRVTYTARAIRKFRKGATTTK